MNVNQESRHRHNRNTPPAGELSPSTRCGRTVHEGKPAHDGPGRVDADDAHLMKDGTAGGGDRGKGEKTGGERQALARPP